MPTIIRHPTREHPRGNQRRPPSPRPVPPPVNINPKTESLDRRIRNLEALGNGVFIGNVLASYMALPGLVGFWPMSSVQRSTGNAYDLSGQGRTLTYNGNPAYTYYNGLVPYIDLDGTGDFLSRADETDLDITGAETIYTTGAAGLTMGGWYWTDVAAAQALMGKYNTTGWLLSLGAGNSPAFTSDAGTFTSSAVMTGEVWHFIVCRFVPSTSLDVYFDGAMQSLTTGVGATMTNTTHAFQIGTFASGSQLLNGRASLVFLCANALGDDLISSLFQTSRVLFSI